MDHIDRPAGQVSRFEHDVRRALAALIDGGTVADARSEIHIWHDPAEKRRAIRLVEQLAEAVKGS
jgi:hypothetical protein